MTATAGRVPAIGGERTVPSPDEIATEYLLLALRLDHHDPGLVDGYYGPADIKARTDLELPRSIDRLRADATALRERVATEVVEPDRRAWLEAQLVALEGRAAVLGGEAISYLDQVERSFEIRPEPRPESVFDTAAVALDATLPGWGSVEARLSNWDDRVTIPPEAVAMTAGRMISALRELAVPSFGVPDGEALRLGLVRDQPWSAYEWYDGGLQSRIDLNTDLPIRAPDLLDTLAHETYGGHHLEHVWKERGLVEEADRLEHSVLLLLTPESLISEGLADLGPSLLIPDDVRVEMLAEALAASHAGDARWMAEIAVAIRPHRRRLGEVVVNAALLRWADGATSDETLAYIERVGRQSPERATKRLEFIEHPRWRTYVHVYHEGEPLLRRWVDAAADGDRGARFGRLLREPATPGGYPGRPRLRPGRSRSARSGLEDHEPDDDREAHELDA